MAGRDAQTILLIEQIWQTVEPVIRSEGMELVEVEYRREPQGWVLRLFIDREDGISVSDCARVSQVVGDVLDVADLIANPYHLEVSSPGLDRPLRKPEHFQRVIGSVVDLRTATPVQNRKHFKGVLVDTTPERVTINCDGQVYEIPLALIDRARLNYFESEQS